MSVQQSAFLLKTPSLFIINDKGCVISRNEGSNSLLETSKQKKSKLNLRTLLINLNRDWDAILPKSFKNGAHKYYLPYFNNDVSFPTGLVVEILPHENVLCVSIQNSNGKLGEEFDLLWKNIINKISNRLSHDFRNIITSTYSLSDLYTTHKDPIIPINEGLKTIKNNAQKEYKILNQALDLYKNKEDKPETLNITQWFNENLSLLELLLPRSCTISKTSHEQERFTNISQQKLKKAILFLFTAIGEWIEKKSELIVTTETQKLKTKISFSFKTSKCITQAISLLLYQVCINIESLNGIYRIKKNNKDLSLIEIIFPISQP